MNKSFYNFEKIEVRGLFYFNFFNRNVQSKHVCQLAYNSFIDATSLRHELLTIKYLRFKMADKNSQRVQVQRVRQVHQCSTRQRNQTSNERSMHRLLY